MQRPLDGITVVALEQVIAGPFATRQLAELGARVIKIERPGGGDAARSYDRTVKGLSSHFVWTNRSKESLSLDAKHPEAKQILCRLIERADVFVQNLAPGAADRLGLGAADLRARQPRLVWCGISGYGPSGPYAEKKAYDLLVQCEAGLLSVTGTPQAASKAGTAGPDIADGFLGDGSLKDDARFSPAPARLQYRDALHAEIARAFAKMALQEVIDRLEAADIANARLNTMREFWRHPQLAARGRWARVGSPAGELDALKPPFNLDGLEPRMDPIPAVGEHTRAVLGELGYTAAEIDRLAADGAV